MSPNFGIIKYQNNVSKNHIEKKEEKKKKKRNIDSQENYLSST
jgi:hypothetical protein